MTYARPFFLPRGRGEIIVRTGMVQGRLSSYAFDTSAAREANEESGMRGLLREVVAIRKVGKKR